MRSGDALWFYADIRRTPEDDLTHELTIANQTKSGLAELSGKGVIDSDGYFARPAFGLTGLVRAS